MGKKTVDQIYQKKTQHEHILTRPDMYIGSIEPITDDVWLYDEADTIMKQRKCTWTPGLYKIFDEILVNAADNKVRDPEGQTTIKVWITEDSVRVYNNGEGIPIQRHSEHQLWIPEMIFGHLLTSSNYDDAEAKVTGGRNGYGAKLTNLYSKRFEVETVHGRSRKKFYMKWMNNMYDHEEPIISSCDEADYTMVTFYPDFARFHTTGFTEDMIYIMKRRVYDVAGCTDKTLKCYLNGERIALTTFPEYVDLYPTMGEERSKASYSRVNDRWEVCVRVSNMGFQQVSFVNAIATTRGGTHVRYIMDQIVAKVAEVAKKKKKTDVKPHMIRPHIFLFVNALIENPGFDSQTKETLTTVKTKFGSTCDIPNSLIEYILKSGIVERSVEMANSKLTKEMASKMRSSDRRQILGIPKLDDANEAGGKNGHRCTLILTEGDSAKALCTAGLAVKNRDYFGVFPLRGKPLNVREASLHKLKHCEEIQSVMKIMGLDIQKKYHSVEGLRYGHLMIMSDQDYDGSHIKGLIINLIHCFWPDLLKVEGFLQQFITPIVKARRKKGRGGGGNSAEDDGGGAALSFFSMPDYFEWKRTLGDAAANYDIRYYKGLGTSGAKEGREYFENIDRHRLDFVQQSEADTDRILMAFAKDRVDDRKAWITNYKTNTNVNETMDYNVRRVSYGEFVDKELILFSIADCERSIPSAIDGFKPGQRKILFSCLKRNLSKAIKVVQLSGYVSEHSAYHHGEQSLIQTIVGMAQNFVGSNNVPLLRPDGQFGTRLQGGKDHAAARYIFTSLMKITRLIFHPADDYIVEYRDDDGQSVEPFYYMPTVPMALINGTSGIGTGFSTNIPNYNPIDVIDNLTALMRGEPVRPMKPWYFGFTGTMEEKEPGKFVSRGTYTIRPDGVVVVTELPIGTWTTNYKKYIEELQEKELIVQYREHNTDVTVDFELFVHPEVLQQWVEQDVVEQRLQLTQYVHATNIIAFNREGQIVKYLDAESLLKEFYLIRLEFYQKRKDYLLGELRRTTSRLENMARFVREVVDGSLVVTKRKKRELLEDLQRRGYTPFPPVSKKKMTATTIKEEEKSDDEEGGKDGAEAELLLAEGPLGRLSLGGGDDADPPEVARASRDYEYLLGMKLWSLTAEMIARLESQLARAASDTAAMEKRTPKELWLEDLEALRKRLESYFADREREIASVVRKKLEKKKPFDPSRLRVPILSDKARQALRKEAERSGKGSRLGGAAAAGGEEGGKPKPKKARRQKKKKGSSEDNSSMDENWVFGDAETSSDSDAGEFGVGDDDDDVPMSKRARKPAAKRSTGGGGAGVKKEKEVKKEKGSRSSGGGAPARKRGKVEVAKAEKDNDDFELDGFGLDALASTPLQVDSKKAPAATHTAAASRIPTTTASASVAPVADDDDLFLLGMDKPTAAPTTTTTTTSAPPAAAKTKSPAKKPAPKRQATKGTPPKKKRKRGSDSESESESDSSSSGGSEYSDESGSGSGSGSSSSDDESSESSDFSD